MQKKLIVGLGNKGNQYEKTRHNIGFATIDLICDFFNIKLNETNFNGNFIKINVNDYQVLLAKPMTLMNNSGDFVRAITQYYKISNEDILIIYDDMDTDLGKIRIREKGSSGGHNGIRDIINKMGTSDIKRIKVGIGHAPNKQSINFVLGKFSQEQKKLVDQASILAKEAAIDFVDVEFNALMSKYNKR